MARKTTPGDEGDLPTRDELDACRQCELWERATQGVAGEGSASARILLVGEQPGNDEDLAGRPFVGPAGLVLRALLGEAGLPAAQVFITNAVKHLYFELRGRRRLHKTPLQRHVAACRRDLRLASGTPIVATYHPSAILRAQAELARDNLRSTLLADLKRVARMAERDRTSPAR